MRKLSLIVLLFGLLTGLPVASFGADLLETTTVCTGSDVTVTTTAETVFATGAATVPTRSAFTSRVRCYGVVTTSANSTTYKLRARRTNVTGTALGDAIAETIKVTAGGVEMIYFEFAEDRTGEFASVNYVCTIEFAGADATSTVGQSCITTDIIN